MRILLIVILLCSLVLGCADNPLGLEPGMWVRHELDGQKYYVTEVDLANYNDQETLGFVRVKDEAGNEVFTKYPIHEFVLWKESKGDDLRLEEALNELRWSRLALEDKRTDKNEQQLIKAIDKVERTLAEESPVFRARQWNPATERYE